MGELPIYRSLIDNAWDDAAPTTSNINPSDLDDVIGMATLAGVADVDRAVEAARRAQPAWQAVSPQMRADILDHVGSALLARRDEFGRMLSREEGKTLAEGVGEAVRAGQIFKFFAGEALRMTGDVVASLRPNLRVETIREPVGVVALITPWNFPLAIPAWKIAPALAYGNAVILKPAELTPACADAIARLLLDAGLPPGVFNILHAPGALIGEALVSHPDVDAVSFTGSNRTGQAIAAAAIPGMKRLQLEMGGKNPMVVMEDADLEAAVAIAVNGCFYSTGQRCTATSRLIVHRKIHDAFIDRLAAAMDALRVGDALQSDTQIGPVASQAQLDNNLRYVALAREEGAEVRGGDRVDGLTRGFYQKPALLLGATNAMRVAREEIFGPIAAVIQAADFEEALAIANDTSFGLSAGICTTSIRYADAFRAGSKAGMVMLNMSTAGVDYHVPFGGRGKSSYGPREQGVYSREFYTNTKTYYC